MACMAHRDRDARNRFPFGAFGTENVRRWHVVNGRKVERMTIGVENYGE